MNERRDEDEQRGEAADDEQEEPEDGRGHAPGTQLLPLPEQLAEDGHEGRGERGVGDERAHEVRIWNATVKALIGPRAPK